ncbi:hypothetical protein [Yellowstone lake phycodnavirus 2]|uniref:hypothetical protein n=1 Tax=Yellowstone lake phycodnavirus 2 TaxID=1586714 RepID=UPI0006EB6C66|nr:hypothetical protein AR678_gp108 [Yellowstone lake phycodnavirus 2]BAT22382.1 hypothetical protein [Yellowstone lake phycodnavirus 2]
MEACQQFAEYVEDIKESLTDGQYKQGMDLCQTLFKKEVPDEKLYRMTYLRPVVFTDLHSCGVEDCMHSRSLNIGFEKKTALVKLKPEHAEEILEDNCYVGGDIDEFIQEDVLANHQEYEEDIPHFQWDTFPVLSLEEVV